MNIVSRKFAKTFVWKRTEYDVELWRHKQRTPIQMTTICHWMKPPPWKFSVYTTAFKHFIWETCIVTTVLYSVLNLDSLQLLTCVTKSLQNLIPSTVSIAVSYWFSSFNRPNATAVSVHWVSPFLRNSFITGRGANCSPWQLKCKNQTRALLIFRFKYSFENYTKKFLQNYTKKYAFLCNLEASFSIMLLRDLLAGETENLTFVVWGSWNKPLCLLGCCKF